jgi:hypothetical protein
MIRGETLRKAIPRRRDLVQQRLNAIGRMVDKRKIVHLLKILLAGKIYFQKCPPALSLDR